MKRFFRGFVYAINGIAKALLEERNLRLHCITGVAVLILSSFYPFSKLEYVILLILIGGVISLELVNSAIERSVDKPLEVHYYSAGAAKDMAAGAVLVFSVISAVCGIALFWNVSVFKQIAAFAFENQILSIGFIIVFALAYAWAFNFRKEEK